MVMAIGQLVRHGGVLLAIVAVMYVGVCFMLFAAQRSMIYQPQRKVTEGSDSTEKLIVPGAELRISFRVHAGSKALIYFGGNSENVSLILPSFSAAFPEHALFLMHYRGYDGSSGKPSEEALRRDALALFDRVHAEYSAIAVVGRSLGSGVAIGVASHRPVSALVLVTPYYSIQDIAERQFPYVPIRWLLIDKFESWRYAPSIRAPTLLLAAANDQVIPPASTEKLFRAFPHGVATLKIIPYFGHNDISTSPLYLEDIGTAVRTANR